MGEFLLGGVLFFVHYNGKCWYLYFRWGIYFTPMLYTRYNYKNDIIFIIYLSKYTYVATAARGVAPC